MIPEIVFDKVSFRYPEETADIFTGLDCCFPLKIDPFFRRILTHPVDLQCTAITPFCRSSSHP